MNKGTKKCCTYDDTVLTAMSSTMSILYNVECTLYICSNWVSYGASASMENSFFSASQVIVIEKECDPLN